MTSDKSAQEILIRIFVEAVDQHYEELKPLFQAISYEILRGKDRWQIGYAITEATSKALDEAIKRHTIDTFGPVVDALAKEKVRAKLAKDLKTRGMDTTILDSIK